MEFQVLGPLHVARDGAAVSITAAHKPRLMLAALLSKAGQPVTIDWLITAVWGGTPPASARRNIQLYVHQLRRVLGTDVLAGRPGGYTIMPGDLDAARFRSLTAQANEALQAGDAERASVIYRAALQLWRGPAFAEFTDCEPIATETRRLEELRVATYERLSEAELALGRHVELIAELADLVDAHPYRESLRGYLMLALYRSGRQAEALEVFRDTRLLLSEQLGIEPGPALRGLHQRILCGEDELVAAPDWLDERCPYLGLMTFQPEHNDRYFGRIQVLQRLLDRVERFPLLGVFGASGSGKSSLLRAGLLGSLGRDPRWRTVLITPTEHPLCTLDKHGTVGSKDIRTLLVVDQFEETFTLCAEETERAQFVARLVGLAADADQRTTVVIGVRADFIGHLTRHADLVEALRDETQLLLGPPTAADLREIIVRPAALAGQTVEPDLLATVLADAAAEPGALPLVSHVLQETWRNRSGPTLTLSAYHASGGVRGAIAQTAERSYDSLSPYQRQVIRKIFLRLTALGEGTEDTRRPIARAELDGIAEPEVITEVLDDLAEARLIVLGEDSVEVAHEALIRAWPRLHGWLTDDRAGLVLHRRLTEAAQTWQSLGRDDSALFRGGRLLTTRTWAEDHGHELNQLETTFLKTSCDLEEAEYGAARRRSRLLKRLAGSMAILLVLAIVAGGVALQQRERARQQQLIELAHQLSLKSRSLLATDPDLAGLLAVAAFRLHSDVETTGAVASAAAAARRRVELNVGGAPTFDVAFSPDGSRIASADTDGIITIWDPVRRTPVTTFAEHTKHVTTGATYARAVAFNDAGTLLASSARAPSLSASAGSIVVWDLKTGRPVFQEPRERLTGAMAFSADGTKIAIGIDQGKIELWDLPSRTHHTLQGHRDEVTSLTFSHDQRLLVSSSGKQEEPVVWDATAGTPIATIPAIRVHTVAFDTTGGVLATGSGEQGVRFWRLDEARPVLVAELPKQSPYAWDISAPVGDRIAVTDENGLITIWDFQRGQPIETYQDRGRAETLSLALSPDGTALVSAGFGRTIVLRDRAVPAFSGHGGAVTAVKISPDGAIVASAGSDTTVRLWDPRGNPLGTLAGHVDRVEGIAFGSDGRQLAAVTRNHTITLWDVEHRQRVKTVYYQGLGASTDIGLQPGGHIVATSALGRFRWDIDGTGPVQAFAGPPFIATALTFSPDGTVLVSSDPVGTVRLWDVAQNKENRRISTGQGEVLDVAISPDGALIATAGADRNVKVWDMQGTLVATLAEHTAPVRVLAFSPDSRALASAGEDRTIIVWDLATHNATAALTGHRGRVQGLAFTAERDLISGGDDSRIIRWSLDPVPAADRICAELGRDLTPQEWATHIRAAPYRTICH